jgi:hypothetical protein
MNSVAVFILSDVRSGSTLLDQCLGAHPDIVSLGEVHWLRAYATEDRSIYDPAHPLTCFCGMRVAACPFWTAVATRLGRPLESLHLRAGPDDVGGVRDGKLAAPWGAKRLFRRCPELMRLGAVRRLLGARSLGRDLAALYDAAAEVSGRRFCVDSSKSSFRFRTLHAADPGHARAIILTRDFRAVVHSRMKRRQSLETAATGWRRKMREIGVLTGDLPAGVVHVLKYEAFCENPRRELEGVCGFLGLEFTDRMLSRPTAEIHHIGGSPSKFDSSLTRISLDRSYESRFSQADLARIQRIAGATGRRWGY